MGVCVLCPFLVVSWVDLRFVIVYLEDNHIQDFYFGRYIVGYTVGNLVLRRRASGAVERDF